MEGQRTSAQEPFETCEPPTCTRARGTMWCAWLEPRLNPKGARLGLGRAVEPGTKACRGVLRLTSHRPRGLRAWHLRAPPCGFDSEASVTRSSRVTVCLVLPAGGTTLFPRKKTLTVPEEKNLDTCH